MLYNYWMEGREIYRYYNVCVECNYVDKNYCFLLFGVNYVNYDQNVLIKLNSNLSCGCLCKFCKSK